MLQALDEWLLDVKTQHPIRFELLAICIALAIILIFLILGIVLGLV